MSNAKVALVEIIDRVPNMYSTNERWVVKKMKLEYANKIVAILPIIYQKDKVQYFSNKFVMMITKAGHGKSTN
jgi:predicted nucleotidyltransferase